MAINKETKNELGQEATSHDTDCAVHVMLELPRSALDCCSTDAS